MFCETITDIPAAVGNRAAPGGEIGLQSFFSDGHSRGIFPRASSLRKPAFGAA